MPEAGGNPGLVFCGSPAHAPERVSDPTPPPSSTAPAAPVRLKVNYKSAESLLGEYNRSVAQGHVAIESRKELPLGTRFVIELRASGIPAAVEVLGEVVEVIPFNSGKYLLGIRYDPGPDRSGVEAVLSRIFAAQEHEKMRRYPRIPINLRANEDLIDSTPYVVRDISRGGAGVVVELPGMPSDVVVGAPFLLELRIGEFGLALPGEVAWAVSPPAERSLWFSPAFGVSFFSLEAEKGQKLDQLLTLTNLPKAPWKARVWVGPDARPK